MAMAMYALLDQSLPAHGHSWGSVSRSHLCPPVTLKAHAVSRHSGLLTPPSWAVLSRPCSCLVCVQLDFDEFERRVMKGTKNKFHQGSNRPKYQLGGGYSLGNIDMNKPSNRKATDAEIDNYMQDIRNAVDGKITKGAKNIRDKRAKLYNGACRTSRDGQSPCPCMLSPLARDPVHGEQLLKRLIRTSQVISASTSS